MKRHAIRSFYFVLLTSGCTILWGCAGAAPQTVPEDTQYAQASNSARIAYDVGLMPQAISAISTGRWIGPR